MLKLEFWIDEDKKDDGCLNYHCCSVDESESEGTLNTCYREQPYDIANKKITETINRMRGDIDKVNRRQTRKKLNKIRI